MSEDQNQSHPPANTQTAARAGFIAKIKDRLAQHHYRYHAYDQGGYRALTWGIIISVLLGMAAVIWLIGMPMYRHHKEFRATTLAASFMAQGDRKNAQLRARQALALNPRNKEATEIMAQLAFWARSPEELSLRQRLVKLDPSVSNKLILVDAAMRLQPPPCPIATNMLAELAASPATNDATYQTLAGRLALALRQPAEAELHFVRAVELDPASASCAVNLAVFRLSKTNDNGKAEARARLEQFRNDPIYGLPALRSLVADRVLAKDFAGANQLSAQLVLKSGPSLHDQLQHLDILHHLNSPDLAAQLAVVQLLVQTNEFAIATVSGWMVANQMAAENIKWLNDLPEEVAGKLPVTVSLATAYEANANWRQLTSVVSIGGWGNLEYLRFALTARAAGQMGLADVARSNWHSAENEANGNLGRLRELLTLANRWRMTPQAEDVNTLIIRDFPQEKSAAQTLTEIYFQTGDTAALNQLFARLNQALPANLEYLNYLTITSLLLKTNLLSVEENASETYAQNQDNPTAAIADAYALHLQHHDAEGIAVIAKLKPDDLAKPSAALYYGVLLSSVGKTQAAAPWLKIARAKENQLLPEEKQLLAATLNGR